jgi:hypothetical protein
MMGKEEKITMLKRKYRYYTNALWALPVLRGCRVSELKPRT